MTHVFKGLRNLNTNKNWKMLQKKERKKTFTVVPPVRWNGKRSV